MNRPGSRAPASRWWLPTAIAAACAVLAVLAVGDGRWHRWLDYRRDDVAHGELWRLVSGHLMHWTGSHAALDVAALLVVAWTFSAALRPRDQVLVCVAAVAAIDAALWLDPRIDRYVGLSGVLHAWFAAGAMRWVLGTVSSERAPFRTAERAWGVALLAALAVKLAVEARTPAPWLPGVDFPVLASAHRWGAAAGATCGLVLAWISRQPRPDVADAVSPDPRPPVR